MAASAMGAAAGGGGNPAAQSKHFTASKFAELPVDTAIKTALRDVLKLDCLTDIQEACIGPALAGEDIHGPPPPPPHALLSAGGVCFCCI